MPFPYEYAMMSYAVYDKKDGVPPQGWRILADTDDYGYSQKGYYACAYYHVETETIVIANRGTELNRWDNITSDLAILTKNLPAAHRYAELFSDAIGREFSGSIFHTGHSLGAIHAELLAGRHGEHAVTFESPGCRTMFDNQPLQEGYNLTHYLSDKNPCNSCDYHVGNIVHLDVMQDANLRGLTQAGQQLYHKILADFGQDCAYGTTNTLKTWITLFAFLGHNFLQVIRYHSMKDIFECFDSQTGYAINAQPMSETEWRGRSQSGLNIWATSFNQATDYKRLNPTMSPWELKLSANRPVLQNSDEPALTGRRP